MRAARMRRGARHCGPLPRAGTDFAPPLCAALIMAVSMPVPWRQHAARLLCCCATRCCLT